MNKVYCCFPGGKHKALTMSYDDGRIQDRKLIEIFNKYGIKGTFHINSGLFDDERRIKADEIKELYKGHEISCHTLTHPTIERCPITEVIQQVLDDRKNLEKIVGYPVRGLSYPNGSVNKQIEEVLPFCGIKYSRIVGDSDDFSMPENPYRWESTCHHNHNLLKNLDTFLSLVKKQCLYLMYVWGHSYEFDDKNNWDLIEEFCQKAGGKEEIWYCTNIELIDCMENFKNLQFAADNSFVYNPNAADCFISVNNQDPICIGSGKTVKI